MRARAVPALLGVLAAIAVAQEQPGEPSPYAAMGFPVMFNDQIITANDVARFLDTPLDQIDPRTLMLNRNLLIFRKINERIAANLSIEIREEAVVEQIRREIDAHGGDAKFYEWLAQQGLTLERYRIEKRQWLVEQLLAFMLRNGFSYDRTQLLPWRVGPTPKEIEIAIKTDPDRREGVLRVKRMSFTVDATPEARAMLALKQARGAISAEDVAAEIEKAARPRVEAALEALKQRPFADVAREYGAPNVEVMAQEWMPVSGNGEAAKFLAKGKVGTSSKPIRQPGGAYEILYLVERENPGERKATDPEVAEEYNRRIRSLRETKWESYLRLKALDESLVEPPRVRDELRSLILGSLREAETGLRTLGLR